MRFLVLLFAWLAIFPVFGAQPEPFVFVVFGATGDLTARKLMPALYHLALEGRISPQTTFVGCSRAPLTHQDFRCKMEGALRQFSRTQPINQNFWQEFREKIFYHSELDSLKNLLEKIDQEKGTRGNRIFYLATPPHLFHDMIAMLHAHDLIAPNQWSRVMIEKPFGCDLRSASNLQTLIEEVLHPSQVFRVDHYLGKEGVQNLLAFRFESGVFEPFWNHVNIAHVQITLAEEIGIGARGAYWEKTGYLRDVFQNHLLQLMALVAMESSHPVDSGGKIKGSTGHPPFS